jgi:D-alanyl-D-alanine carboxypeptidase/D-alanyl-D-alanine-endopeptidase (penicillin-binding protein 4)
MLSANVYTLTEGKEKYREREVPFFTGGLDAAVELLRDTLGLKVEQAKFYRNKNYRPVYSQPVDSVLKPMMHRSDNFFAEQMLMMVGQQLTGEMNDAKATDTLLKTIYADLPQKPRWADGSGLSRYNLFSPDDFVMILDKMRNDFGMDRIRNIFATGGEGTISSYYKSDSSFIYGKTGTLSGVVAFSGFLYTKKGKLLIFSTLVNNHNRSATEVRRTIEKFLQGIRRDY